MDIKNSIKSTLVILLRTNKILRSASLYLYLISITSSVIIGIYTPLNMWIWKNILDLILSLLSHEIGLKPIFMWMFIYFLIQLIQKVVTDVIEYFKAIYSEQIDLHIKTLLLSSITKMELSEFDDYKLHNEISKANQESTARSLNTLQTILQIIQYGISFLGSVVLLISFNTSIVFLTLIYAIPLFYVSVKIMDQLYNIFDARFEKIRFSRNIQTLLTKPENIKEIKIYRISHFLTEKIISIYKSNLEEDKKIRAKIVLKNSIVSFLEEFVNTGIKLLIVVLGFINNLTIGSINMYISSVDSLALSVTNLLGLSSNLYENTLYLSSIFQLIDREPKKKKKNLFNPSFRCIEFNNVSFKYPGTNKYVLKNINLKLYANQTYAFVGENGSGKTTLIKLLLNLYSPTEGNIYVDDQNLEDIDFNDYCNYINAVFQDFVRYPFDIKTNIGIGDINSVDDMKKIKQSAKYAGIDDYIENLPKKYDSQLQREWKESTDVSLGQWQKIAVARAFMKKSSILVLDEPTASMDVLSEAEIFKTFKELKKNQLCLFVTHRLSNINQTDNIIVLDQGQIIQKGTHEELIKLDGLYQKLYNTQASFYKNETEEIEYARS